MKDYYQILNVHRSASPEDIKKSFRKLALKYHPDKHQGNTLVTATHFTELKEAYDTLRDRRKKARYDFEYSLQPKGANYQQPVSTPEEIINKASLLRHKLAAADPFRINNNAVYEDVSLLVSAHNLIILQAEEDIRLIEAFTDLVLFCCQQLAFVQQQQICHKLLIINHHGDKAHEKIELFIREQKWIHYWAKYKTVAALLLALLLCCCIYFLGRA